MSKLFYINAQKLVDLVQTEIEADTEQEAIEKYLRMAHRGEIDVADFNWPYLGANDLDVEDHGEV